VDLFRKGFADELEALSADGRRLVLAMCADICGSAVVKAWPETHELVRSAIDAAWNGRIASVKAAAARVDEEFERRTKTGVGNLGVHGIGTLGVALDLMSRPRPPETKRVFDTLNESVGVVMYAVQNDLLRRRPDSKPIHRLHEAKRSEPVTRLIAAVESAISIVKSGGGREQLREVPFLSFPSGL
jgi:hypothetical protein